MNEFTLHGVLPALATPFDERGEIRPERLVETVRRLSATGIAGVLVAGSTGEAASLDEFERAPLIAAARDGLGPDRPVIAGVDAHATRAAIRQAASAARSGADAVLVLTPFYYREAMTVQALVGHFREVADASPLPVVLYSVPKFTGLAIPVEAAVALSGHPNVVGMKDSAGDIESLRRIVEQSGREFTVMTGHAGSALEAFRSGARGAILAAASAVPEPFVRLAAMSDDASDSDALARAAASLAAAIAGSHGVAGVKAAMALRGLEPGPPRPPLAPPDPAGLREIGEALDRAVADGLLPRLGL